MTYVPAEEDDVEDFNTSMGNGPGQTMQLDFGKGHSSCQWNKLILKQVYELIVTSREADGDRGLADVSEGYIMGLLQGQLKQSQESWAWVQPCFLPESSALETQDQAAERVKAYHQKQMASTGGRALRKRVSKQQHILNCYSTYDSGRNSTSVLKSSRKCAKSKLAVILLIWRHGNISVTCLTNCLLRGCLTRNLGQRQSAIAQYQCST